MPGEVSRAFDPEPDDHRESRDKIVYDVDVQGEYDAETLKGEIRRLRNLLNDCWASAGLLGSDWTKQPWQAWEEPSDLVSQIDELHSDADAYRNDEDRDGIEDDTFPAEQEVKFDAT